MPLPPAPSSAQSAAVATAANGLWVLGGGAVFVGIPAIVIGAFQSGAVLAAGLGYVVVGLWSCWSAVRLRRSGRDWTSWLTLALLVAVMVGRFLVAPPKLPLSLIEGTLGLLGLVSLVQLASLPRVPPSGDVSR